jgi:hypothetical protein
VADLRAADVTLSRTEQNHRLQAKSESAYLMMFAKIVVAEPVDHVAQRPQAAAMASLSMFHEAACATGGYAASPTSICGGNIALRFAAAESLAQAIAAAFARIHAVPPEAPQALAA